MGTFVAPDGTEFTELRAYRRHVFEEYFCFKNRENEELQKSPGEINGQEFQLSDLDTCKVLVLDCMDRSVVTGLKNCTVFLGPTIESSAIRKCEGCTFTVVAKEVRLTDCSNCTVRAFSPNPVQIDNCHGIRVGNFNGSYSGLTQHFADAGLQPTSDHVKVVDYSARDQSLPTPHFTMLSSEEQSDDWVISLDNALGPPENPIRPGAETFPPPPPRNPPPDLNPEPTVDAPDVAETDEPRDDFGFSEDEPIKADGHETDDPFGDGGDTDGHDPFGDESGENEIDGVAADPFGAGSDVNASEPIEFESEQDPFEQTAAAHQNPYNPPAAPPADSFAAFDDENIDARVEWETKFKQAVAIKDEENRKKQALMREKAEEELDEHYAERTNRNAIRSSSNRDAEKDYLEHRDNLAASTDGASCWEKACSLVDVNKKDEDECDRSRMRGLLLQLKNCN